MISYIVFIFDWKRRQVCCFSEHRTQGKSSHHAVSSLKLKRYAVRKGGMSVSSSSLLSWSMVYVNNRSLRTSPSIPYINTSKDSPGIVDNYFLRFVFFSLKIVPWPLKVFSFRDNSVPQRILDKNSLLFQL